MVRDRPSQTQSLCPVCNQLTDLERETWPERWRQNQDAQPLKGDTNRLRRMDGILRLRSERGICAPRVGDAADDITEVEPSI